MIGLPLMTTSVKTKTRICPICHGSGLKDGMGCSACDGKGEIPQTPPPKPE
jgi:DnaJ-class molecular chaperone